MSLSDLSPASAALLHGLWQGLAIAAVAALAMRFIESAKHRYALLWVALISAFALPLAYLAAQPNRILTVATISETPVTAPAPAFDWTPYLVSLWAAGALFGLARLFVAWTRVNDFSKNCDPASPELRDVRDRVIARMGIRRYVRVRTSVEVEAPATIGSARPIVVWPACGFDGLTETETEALMAHELAHIRRRDYAWHLLQRAVEALLWCNPGALCIGWMLRQEREKAADELAAEALQDGKGLAIALGRLALQRSGRTALSLAADDGDVGARMKSLCVWSPKPLGLRAVFGIVVGLAVLGFVGMAAARAAAATKVETLIVQAPGKQMFQIKLDEPPKDSFVYVRGVGIGQSSFASAQASMAQQAYGRVRQVLVVELDKQTGGMAEARLVTREAHIRLEGSSFTGMVELKGSSAQDFFKVPLNGLP